jgi:hypothetical protein
LLDRCRFDADQVMVNASVGADGAGSRLAQDR